MADCDVCNLCDAPGNFAESKDVAQVVCNVRAFGNEVFTFWRCPNCQSLHCREHVDLDWYYRAYPVKGHTLDFWARAAYGNFLQRLDRAGLSPSMSVLDYGCGPGLLVRYFTERGFPSVKGYDAHVSEFSDKSILAQQYDCVISQDVIEHAEDPQQFLRDLSKLLKPGGLLVIGTPNATEIDLAKAELFSLSLHPPYHRHVLSEQALLGIAERAGLKSQTRYYRFYYDTLWPTVNYRFLRGYVRRAGNVLDAAFEPPRVGLVLTSPILWAHALFGYFYPPRSEMMVLFRRVSENPASDNSPTD